MAEESILKTMKRAMELAQPDLRTYYRVVRKAKIVASYASDGQYYADVQPLRNDETDDTSEPVIPRVEIPIMWGGPKRGVVCPPTVGTLCDLSYYDGDPNYPRISNFRWQGNTAPECELDEFVIQLEPGVEIRIDKEKKIVSLTTKDVDTKAGENVNTEAGQNWTIKAGQVATIEAPQIMLIGNVTTRGKDGQAAIEENGDRTQNGNLTINGNLSVSGMIYGRVAGCSGCH